jgi:hypothetical protein
MSTGTASTTIRMTNVITFKNALKDKLESGYDVGPIHPSTQVSSIFNKYLGANSYYKRVFFQNYNKTRYYFDPEDYFILNSDKEIKTKIDATSTNTRPGVKEHALKYLNDYEEAMKLVSRQITSLANYVETKKNHIYMKSDGTSSYLSSVSGVPHGGVTSLQGIRAFNGGSLTAEVKSKALRDNVSATKEVPKGVPVYYDKILGYSYLKQEVNGNKLFTNRPTSLLDYPDFIDDWAGKIEKYRIDILDKFKDNLIN